MKQPIALFLPTLCLSLMTGVAADSKINRNAQALAKHLAATTPAKKTNSGDFLKIRGRMINAIQVIEDANRSNGPRPESLISTALSFRDDMSGFEKMLTTNAVLTAWREANARGLFDKGGKFQDRITKGRGVGDKVLFELIVPAESFPPGSNQLANLRLVTVDTRREKGAKPTPREIAHQKQLVNMINEKKSRTRLSKVEKGERTNAVGQTESESLALWENDMAEAGEKAQQPPTIRLNSRMSGTPSHMTGDRWRNSTEVINLSPHPTEVSVDVYIIGITDEKRDYYLMSKTNKSIKLRQNESLTLESFSKAENSYKGKADDHDEIPKKERNRTRVRCRGFAVIVTHGKKVVKFTGSDQLLTRYADPSVEDLSLNRLMVF